LLHFRSSAFAIEFSYIIDLEPGCCSQFIDSERDSGSDFDLIMILKFCQAKTAIQNHGILAK